VYNPAALDAEHVTPPLALKLTALSGVPPTLTVPLT
jgi:hypothetical protein